MKLRKLAKTGVFASLAIAMITTVAHADEHDADKRISGHTAQSGYLVAKVRQATKRFRDVQIAEAEGYAPGPCVSGPNGGAMGIHYVNAAYLEDESLIVEQPEALIYEPLPDGRLRLVGVEYITLAGPAVLEGHLLNLVGAPNRYGLPAFYELHVWAWRRNPNGTFADWNPRVSCSAATGI